MKRFIPHNELARDSRFVRQDNAQATVLSTLPDDVDTVVEVFEKFSPMIEASVQGTAAQPLFEKYGPGFSLTILNEPLDPEAPAALTRLLLRMHGIFVGELQALEPDERRLRRRGLYRGVPRSGRGPTVAGTPTGACTARRASSRGPALACAPA